ncbi:MAG: bifunctional 3'-5' exonuclease/DNA polymerase [Microbacterium sp.]
MTAAPRWHVVGRGAGHVARHVAGQSRDEATIIVLGDDLAELDRLRCGPEELAAHVIAAPEQVRWVFGDTTHWYPGILAGGARVARCHDLRLCHAILTRSALATDPAALRAAEEWDASSAVAEVPAPTLFDLDDAAPRSAGVPDDPDAALAELRRQLAAVASSSDPQRLRLLLAAESAGALIAAELHAAGMPWSRAVHERILTDLLGPRPAAGAAPARVLELAAVVRDALGDPGASLDSQPKLLRSLHRVGVLARTTSRWELADYDHPAIAPLLEYKKLTRLMSANGWAWLDEWASDGRFRPVYVPGGVVTGRWASSGGGALQLPRRLRPAVRANPGWTLVVADVAQLEPRVLAAMSSDHALADAARGRDLYDGIAASGIVTTRQEAKIAMLGAMYGATTGDSGRLVPALRRVYPRAMSLVDEAARTGAEGGVVSTWLGRTSPPADAFWREAQDRAGAPDATEADRARARRVAADRGRFTRNFVVQGTAAEWALAWLAELRTELARFPAVSAETTETAAASGPVFGRGAHLCFFLHDEIIVHCPEDHAAAVADAVRTAASRAARLLFGDFPIDFPLDLRISADAAK